MSNLYANAKLIGEKKRLETRVSEIFFKGFRPKLNANEVHRLGTFRLEFPLIGYNQHPLDFYTNSETRSVFMPILSLLFLEDLSTAYAWLWANQYNLDTIDEYVTMLKYKLIIPPLQALQIPEKALTDRKVEELSLRFRNSAYAFILAHELGHIYYGHIGYANLLAKQAQDNEEAADLFALELMGRTATIPMGVLLWFQATAYYLPNRGNFNTDVEWETFLTKEATHPLTPHRLYTLAKWLNKHAYDFARNEANKTAGEETIQLIADGIVEIARVLEDIDIQRLMAAKAQKTDLFSLAPRRISG